MEYTFEIVGVSPILYFFQHQQQVIHTPQQQGVEYLGAYKCTLDAFLKSIETIPPKQTWNLEQVVNTVVSFWMHNSDTIQYWKSRFDDAGGGDNLLVARVADVDGLKAEFEALLGNG
jgi:hypothetical protein